MKFIDKMFRNSGKLAYGWCPTFDTFTSGLSYSSNNMFFSFALQPNTMFSGIDCIIKNGSNPNQIRLYIEDNKVYLYSLTNLLTEVYYKFEETKTYRIQFSLFDDIAEVRINNYSIIKEEVSDSLTISGCKLNISYVANNYFNLYDIKLGQGIKLDFPKDYSGMFCGEFSWLPMQEGSGNTVYDVISNTNSTLTNSVWEKERKEYFYNQFYGFVLNTGVLIPNKYTGSFNNMSLKDDGQTWIDYSRCENNYFNKQAYKGNSYGLPELFNESIYYSKYYSFNLLKFNFFLWNINELFKMYYDFVSYTVVPYTYFCKRGFNNYGTPFEIYTNLYYSRTLTQEEKNNIYDLFGKGFDDFNDDPLDYYLPPSSAGTKLLNVELGVLKLEDGVLLLID